MILGIIPARSGSKRLPNKNIRLLGGKPLIAWTIEASKDIPGLEVIISTDSPEIAEISKEYGGNVPWLRPSELSTDNATPVDVCLHAMGYKKYDGIMLLQPTSPFRTRQTILRAMDEFCGFSVVGVNKTKENPYWMFKKSNEFIVPLFEGGTETRSQDTETYILNGAMYLVGSDYLKNEKSFITRWSIPLEIEYPENLDIDTLGDFNAAERELQLREESETSNEWTK